MSVNHRKPWSQEELARLKELRDKCVPMSKVAEMLGRTWKACTNKAYLTADCSMGGSWKELSEEQLEWLDKHFKHTRNIDIQRRLNLSYHSLQRIARMRGLKKSKQFLRKRQVIGRENAYESHKRNGTFPPKGYRIPNSGKNSFGDGRSIWDMVSKRKAEEMKRKARETRRKNYESERRRVLYFGFEPRTKYRFVRQSRSKVNYRFGLRRCGYIEDPEDHNLYYYPDEQMRRPTRESHGAAYGIRFKPLEDED